MSWRVIRCLDERGQASTLARVVCGVLVLGGLVLGGLVLGGLGGAHGSAALASPQPGSTMPSRCQLLVERTTKFEPRIDRQTGTLSWRGRSIPLTGPGLASYRPGTSQEALWFHSLAWLIPLVEAAPGDVERIVQEYGAALPDPGSQAARVLSRRVGWSEGQIRRRLESLECMYRATRRTTFADVARDLGSALMDDRRYYGLPLRPPHNHGAQSNRLLIRVGPLFDRPEWVTKSRERILRDRSAAFAECGMSDEQSSRYHHMNVALWERLAASVRAPIDAAPRAAARALVRPDGVVEPVGDGQVREGRLAGGSLWCADLGWAANTRAGMHYVLRFGPKTTRHGHNDHAALTWFTNGIPVLVDRGTAPKSDPRSLSWSRSVAAHSTLERVGATQRRSMSGERTGPDAYVLESITGDPYRRSVRFAPEAVSVSDRASAPVIDDWIQHWHFAPGWEPVLAANGAASGVMIGPDGASVRLSCAQAGKALAPEPVRVPSYASDPPQWAWDMQCRARGSRVAFDSQVRWDSAG